MYFIYFCVTCILASATHPHRVWRIGPMRSSKKDVVDVHLFVQNGCRCACTCFENRRALHFSPRNTSLVIRSGESLMMSIPDDAAWIDIKADRTARIEVIYA